MRKIHYISGLIITIFVGFHLFNHFCSIWGVDKHIEIMGALRLFYRNVFIETILLSAILVQIFSGFKLFKTGRGRGIATSNFEKLHFWTGLYLAIFFVIHLGAVLVGRHCLDLDTNFYFGVVGLNTFPHNLLFIPYYALAIIAFFGHIAAIHSKKMKHNIFGLTPIGQSKTILILGIGFTVFIFYGLTNHFDGVEIPTEYNVVIGK